MRYGDETWLWKGSGGVESHARARARERERERGSRGGHMGVGRVLGGGEGRTRLGGDGSSGCASVPWGTAVRL